MKKQLYEDPIKEHTFDGIQEYDKKLPNWWLWTLYLSIIFSVFYWAWTFHSGLKLSAQEQLDAGLVALSESASEGESRVVSDSDLWAMSQNERIVAEGQKIYASTCASCHGANLEGGIGLSLADAEWKNGEEPSDLINTVMYGVLENGMPAWGSVLGERRVQEVVAYVLSKHQPAE